MFEQLHDWIVYLDA